MASEGLRRYGSMDVLTPTSRSSLRSRSLQNTPLKNGISPLRNILTTDSYVQQKQKDEEIIHEINGYFQKRGSCSEMDPPVPTLNLVKKI